MDPTTDLREFLIACQEENRDGAMEALRHLAEWVHSGGFLPDAWLATDQFRSIKRDEYN
jgi:hypothetical protein